MTEQRKPNRAYIQKWMNLLAMAVHERRVGNDAAALDLLDQAGFELYGGELPTWAKVRRKQGRPQGTQLDDSKALRLMAWLERQTGVSQRRTLAKEVLLFRPDLVPGGGTKESKVERLAEKFTSQKK